MHSKLKNKSVVSSVTCRVIKYFRSYVKITVKARILQILNFI